MTAVTTFTTHTFQRTLPTALARLDSERLLAAAAERGRHAVLLEDAHPPSRAGWGVSPSVPGETGSAAAPAGGGRRPRWRIVAVDPVWVLRADRGQSVVSHVAPDGTRRSEVACGDPLAVLAQRMSSAGMPFPAPAAGATPGAWDGSAPRLPFTGGAIGVIGYDYVRRLYRLPEPPACDTPLPEFWFGFYDFALVFDTAGGRGWLVGLDRPETHAKAARWLRSLEPALLHEANDVAHDDAAPLIAAPLTSNLTPDGYRRMVERALARIRAGELDQVNLAQRWRAPLRTAGQRATAVTCYARLLRRSPSPFAAWLDLGDAQVVSASPERLLFHDGQGYLETRPIKGTRPRHPQPQRDRDLAAALLRSEKDATELAPTVGVARADLARVCRFGSVHVTEPRHLASLPSVHHTVAAVGGRLRPGIDVTALLRAVFPGASITGAPKTQAIAVINEFESVRRGFFTGTAGYLSLDGQMDFNVLIRTATLVDGHVLYHAGGGIVAASRPDLEYEESLAKAAAMAGVLSGGTGAVAPPRA